MEAKTQKIDVSSFRKHYRSQSKNASVAGLKASVKPLKYPIGSFLGNGEFQSAHEYANDLYIIKTSHSPNKANSRVLLIDSKRPGNIEKRNEFINQHEAAQVNRVVTGAYATKLGRNFALWRAKRAGRKMGKKAYTEWVYSNRLKADRDLMTRYLGSEHLVKSHEGVRTFNGVPLAVTIQKRLYPIPPNNEMGVLGRQYFMPMGDLVRHQPEYLSSHPIQNQMLAITSKLRQLEREHPGISANLGVEDMGIDIRKGRVVIPDVQVSNLEGMSKRKRSKFEARRDKNLKELESLTSQKGIDKLHGEFKQKGAREQEKLKQKKARKKQRRARRK